MKEKHKHKTNHKFEYVELGTNAQAHVSLELLQTVVQTHTSDAHNLFMNRAVVFLRIRLPASSSTSKIESREETEHLYTEEFSALGNKLSY